MKKSLFLISALMLTTHVLMAQFSFGLKACYNSNKLNSDINSIKDYTLTDLKDEAKTGYSIGAWARLGQKVYLQPELYYATKGGDMKYSLQLDQDIPVAVKKEFTLSAVDIPILLGYKIIDMKLVNARVFAGPVASFVINKKIKTSGGSDKLLEKDDLKDAIWGIQAGAGVDVLMFTLDLRYEWGLNNLYDIDGNDIKSRMLIVSLGYKLF